MSQTVVVRIRGKASDETWESPYKPDLQGLVICKIDNPCTCGGGSPADIRLPIHPNTPGAKWTCPKCKALCSAMLVRDL